MHQTRLVSLVEAAINTVIGFAVSFAVWPFAAWITGIEYSRAQHWAVIAIFTIASVARGYVIRRFFNAGLHLAAVRIASRMARLGAWRDE